MSIDGRETETGKKTEQIKKRAQIYTGEGYMPGQKTVRRKIGSLVESERGTESDRTAERRVRDAESGRTAERRVRDAESDRTAERRVRDAEGGRTAERRVRDAEGGRTAERRVRDAEGGRTAERRVHDAESAQQQEDPARKRVQAGSWKEKMKERRRRRLCRIFGTLGALILIAYIGVAVYFNFHFYEDTTIYGINCSQKTVDEVKLEVADKLDEYALQIEGRNGKTETITADQIGLAFVDNSSIDRMMKAQRSYVWPIMILMEKSSLASVAFSYDEAKAKEALESLNCMDEMLSAKPQDAYIATTDTGFEVVGEVPGTLLDPEKTQDAVLSALDKGASKISLDEEDCYVNPEIYQDNEGLISEAQAKNELARAYITYDFGDRQEIVNAPVIADWIVQMSDGTYVIDDMAVTEYVEALAAKYDTFGLTRTFYTSIGTTVTLTGGDYGWCIDQDATIVALMQALESGYQGTMEPEYLYTAMSRDTNDIGYTYVEICISQQRMWCYENGTCIVDTPVVTGNPNKDNATPSGGVWAIDAKKRDAILEGEGYEAPVDYWMPFNDDVGIHDMKERAYFGSTIYLTNGSHGCVNTPYEAVQTIYNAVSIGTPVIVYE